MQIKFSQHALRRMRQRNIGKSIVMQTLTSPDDIYTDGAKGKLYLKRFGSKLLKVPVIENKTIILVKSVFFE